MPYQASYSNYSSTTTAPSASKVDLSLSASSFERFSLRTLGTDSTNFFACEHVRQPNARFPTTARTSIKVRLGTNALTSRMTFGFAAASNDLSMTLNIVFSLGFSCRRSHAPHACPGQDSPRVPPQRARPQAQAQPRASRVPGYSAVSGWCVSTGRARGRRGLALSRSTRSAACRRVRREMSPTMRSRLGSGVGSAAVASHRARPVRDASLAGR